MQLKSKETEERRPMAKTIARKVEKTVGKTCKELKKETETMTSPSSDGTKNETEYAVEQIEQKAKATACAVPAAGRRIAGTAAKQIYRLRMKEKGEKERKPGEEKPEEKETGEYQRPGKVKGKERAAPKEKTRRIPPGRKSEKKKRERVLYQRQKAWRKSFRERRRKRALRKKEELAVKAKAWKASAIGLGLCLLVLLCVGGMVLLSTSVLTSSTGIFFSDEIAAEGELTIQDAIREVNGDFQKTIEAEEEMSGLGASVVEGSKTTWREILALYAIKYQRDYKDEVFSVTEEKIQEMKDIFWDSNSYELSRELRRADGEKPGESTPAKDLTETLVVTVYHKDVEEMAEEYSFTAGEKRQLKLLLSDGVKELWDKLLYGTGSYSDLVEAAASQLGEIGGEPYWSWWGYRERVEWCAIFVSWCGEMCGYLEESQMPKFENCQDGAGQFRENYGFEQRDVTPESGWIIFFDWGGDGIADHVGIVESCEDGIITTIEGNSGDMCREKTYPVGSSLIYGYGIPEAEEE